MTPAGEELEQRAGRASLRWGWFASMVAGLALGALLGQLVLRWGR